MAVESSSLICYLPGKNLFNIDRAKSKWETTTLLRIPMTLNDSSSKKLSIY
jgi:hypothetical protein